MPPLPTLHVAVLAGLARELRYAPRATLLRHIERAERLAMEIDPDAGASAYPDDWIVFRVTGYRPDASPVGGLVPAPALLGDLPALVEHLCAAAGLRAEDLPPGRWVRADELCAAWTISRRTLTRLRARGLTARRVTASSGKSVLLFDEQAAAKFRARHAGALERAARFSRVDPDVRARIVRRAERYRARLGWSLNRCAARLAARYGRGRETVRAMLRAEDDARRVRGAPALFPEPGPISARERAVAWRAWRRGLPPADVGARLGRSRAVVARAIDEERARRLRALGLGPAGVHAPPAGVLDADAARVGLGARGAEELTEFLESARAMPAPDATEERARAEAHALLLQRAAGAIAALAPIDPASGALDRAERDLRWAARLRAELVRGQLGLVVRTIESTLGHPPERLRAEDARALVLVCLRALVDACASFEPAPGRRLAGPAAITVGRAAGLWARGRVGAAGSPAPRGAALPRLRSGVRLDDWTRRVAPWQAFLEPDRRVVDLVGPLGLLAPGGPHATGLDPADARLLAMRSGLGAAPMTLDECADALGVSRLRVQRDERRALRAALTIARRAPAPGATP